MHLKWLWSAVFALLFIFTAMLTCVPGAGAQNRVLETAVLHEKTESLSLAPYTIIQKDPWEAVTPAAILSSEGRILTGKLSRENVIYLGYSGIPAWLTIKLTNKSQQKDWVIDLGRRVDGRMGRLESALAYEFRINDAGKAELKPLTDSTGQGVFKIHSTGNEEKFILIRVHPAPGLPSILPLKIYSEKAYLNHLEWRFLTKIIYGVILCGIGVFFAAFSFLRKNRAGYSVCIYFTYAAVCWVAYDWLGAQIGSSLFALFMLGMFLGYALLCIHSLRVFCEIDYTAPSENAILHGLAWLNIGSAILTLVLPVSDGMVQLSLLYGAPLIMLLLLSLLSFAKAQSGHIQGYDYFLGWMFPLAGYACSIFSSTHLLPASPALLNAFWLLLPFQGFFIAKAFMQKAYASETGADVMFAGSFQLSKLRETKDQADYARLLKVIEKEREMLAELKVREESRTEEMRRAKEIADEANRAKSAFLAVVSHEIRTPMTGVMGMVRLLLDSSLSKQQRDYAMTIQESSEAMMGLLNDILDFEKIQRGKIELENISFDLHRLIHGIVTLMSGHATEKGISLSARVDENLPRYVKGDPTRLRQVLLNLMGNGIKFTERGSVTLLVKNLDSGDSDMSLPSGRYMIYFAVQDTGIGIPLEAQKNLFNPFSQASASISRKFGGSGLGLAISKGLIEIMGSTVNISSKEGEGSTFFFTLEMDKGLSAGMEQVKKIPVAAEGKSLRILVVDDNMITRKVITGFLEQGKHAVTGCGSAEEALQKIGPEIYDIVFMDIELPGIPGNEAAKRLRESGDAYKTSLPVIAVTGNISREEMERYLADGMSGFIGKPVERDRLMEIVQDVASKSFEREIRMPKLLPQENTTPPDIVEPSRPALDLPKDIFNPDMLVSLKNTIGMQPLKNLLEELVEKAEEIISQMEQSLSTANYEEIGARAHELKGMTSNFGLTELSQKAKDIETAVKTQQLDNITAIVKTLPEICGKAKTILEEWVLQ
jgi:signal transduction histidine kinase/DNA-binding NarL/FixJ family response regulator/HPt (histidine-containing phosphotransfer) domain-containing protein